MKLSRQIYLFVIAIVLLTSTSNLLLNRYQQRQIHMQAEANLVATLLGSLDDVVIQDVITNNKLKIIELFRRIKNSRNQVEFLYITDNRNRVFVHSFENGFPQYLFDAEIKSSHLASDSNNVSIVGRYRTRQGIINVYAAELIPGLGSYLHVGLNQSAFNATFAENNWRMIYISLAITAFILFIAYFFATKLTRPLEKLSAYVKQYGSGKNSGYHGIDSASYEIRNLLQTFETAKNERQAALDKLARREKFLDITLNSIGDAVIVTDSKGQVLRMNGVAENLTGWNLQQAADTPIKTIFPIIDATTREPIDNPVDKVLQTGETVYLSNHTTLIARDGTEYQIADSAAPIKDGNTILGMVLIFNDVTEQYRVREALYESEQRLRQLTENMKEVFWLSSPEWDEISYISPSFEDIWGYSCENLYRNPRLWLEAIHPDDVQQVLDDIPKDINKLEKEIDFREYRIINEKGDTVWIKARAYPIYDNDGNVVRIAGIAENITDHKLVNETLQRTQKMNALGKLTGGIAHDYNNMLGVVLGYAELLSTMLSDREDLKNYADQILHASERGAKLTRKLLAFSRYQPSEVDVVDLNNLLNEQIDMLQKTMTARIQLHFKPGDELWPVCADPGELEDAILNISINAMHAMERGGDFTITTENKFIDAKQAAILDIKQGNYVHLALSDTGKGMDNETVAKIFEPFFSTKGEMGTGLGLSQVYGFVRRCNGTVTAESSPGKGTTIHLYFPECRQDEIELEEEKSDSAVFHGEGTRILIVDDEPALLALAEDILVGHGYIVYTAESGEKALEILENNEVEILLSDIIMPVMDGVELAERVMKQYPQVKIQLASGYMSANRLDDLAPELKNNVLNKPYNSKTLLLKVQQLLDS